MSDEDGDGLTLERVSLRIVTRSLPGLPFADAAFFRSPCIDCIFLHRSPCLA